MEMSTSIQAEEMSLFDFISSTMNDRLLKQSDLEKNTRMSYSSINRTFKRLRDFTPLEYTEILNYLFSPEESLAIVNKYAADDSALIKLVNDVLSGNQTNDVQESFLKNQKTFSLANQIELGYFKNTKQIKEIYGLAGLEILNQMANENIITISTNGNISGNFDRIKPSFGTIRRQISLATNYHKDKNCGKLKNFIYFGTRLVSKETRTYVQILTRLFKEIISSILHDDKIDEAKVNNLVNHLRSFSGTKSNNRTEPIFYSILLDDFKTVSEGSEVLQ